MKLSILINFFVQIIQLLVLQYRDTILTFVC